MQRLTSIVAVNREGVIGCRNTLPWRLRTDMRFFREQTTGNTVIMGRKTFDSLGRKPLGARFNVVISHHFGLFSETPDCVLGIGIEDGLFRASLAPKPYKETFVMGGESMYKQFAPYADRYLITLVEKEVRDGDTFFDQNFLGNPDEWDISKLRSVPAGPDDEAAFSVFEVTSKRPGLYLDRRHEAIESARRLSTSGTSPKSRSVARRTAVSTSSHTHSML